jgi:hypothetical protein
VSALADVLFQEEFSDGASPAQEIGKRDYLSGHYYLFIGSLEASKGHLLTSVRELSPSTEVLLEDAQKVLLLNFDLAVNFRLGSFTELRNSCPKSFLVRLSQLEIICASGFQGVAWQEFKYRDRDKLF